MKHYLSQFLVKGMYLMSGRMKCKVCGYIYDPEKGEPRANVEPGTEWEDVPDKFKCPSCGAPKRMFKPL